MTTINELLDKRRKTLDSMKTLWTGIADAGREATADEQKQFDAMEASVKAMDKSIGRIKAVDNAIADADEERKAYLETPVGRDAILPTPANVQKHYPLGDRETPKHYSFRRVMMANFKNREVDGLEGEMAQEGQKEKLPASFSEAGNYIPFSALSTPCIDKRNWQLQNAGVFRNDLGVINDKGEELVDESRLMAPIDILYHYMVLPQLGVPMMMGAGPNVRYPVFAAGSDTPAEKAQDADAEDLNPTTSDFELTPKRLPIFTKLNQQIVIQSDFDVQAWLANFLMKEIAQQIQKQFINGTGSSNQPQGLLATATAPLAAAQTVAAGANGDAVSRAKLVSLIGIVDAANALTGRTGFLMNSKTRTKLQNTLLDTGSGRFVMEGAALPSIGESVAVTNQVPSNGSKGTGTGLSTVIFGNWSDSVIVQWGGIWTLADPYTQAVKGLTALHAATYYDTKVLRAASFAKAVHLTTT